MRTTLTIDDDVAALLERLRKRRSATLRDLVNEALPIGLPEIGAGPARREQFHTQSVDLGRALVASIDNISEALRITESDALD